MSISLITNFKINSDNPIDTRMVATGPDGLTNMEYKYEGLTVYRTDTGYNYIWDGASWKLVSNGIYGGSGSLVGDTSIDTGSVGPNISDQTKSLIISASDSNEIFNLSSYFERNESTDVEFRHTLSFGTISGPYISFNPKSEYLLKRGGVSIATGDSVNYIVTERMKIYNDGLIRFTPNGTYTFSLNIFHNNNEMIIGRNWHSSKDDVNFGSSFLSFNDQILTINHSLASSTSYTHSLSLNHPSQPYSVEVNGGLSTTQDILLGNGQAPSQISFGGVGMIIDKSSEEVSLFNNTNIKGISLKDKLVSIGTNNYEVSITSSSTFSVFGHLSARYTTNIWDNAFNVDRVNTEDTSLLDNYWIRSSNSILSNNDQGSTNSVNVILNTGSFSQDMQLIFNPISYVSKDSRSTWINAKKPYDRFFYFYTPPSEYSLIHNIRWYLSNDDQLNWKQIGHLETGNQNNYNTESGATSSYANRYYSQSVLVPANMDFRITISFPFDFVSNTIIATYSLPSVIFTSLRSGNWRTVYSDPNITNI